MKKCLFIGLFAFFLANTAFAGGACCSEWPTPGCFPDCLR